jgi:DNA-binding MarR family transcriptional regulator
VSQRAPRRDGERADFPRSPCRHEVGGGSIQAATETMLKLAAISRRLRSAGLVIEKIVHDSADGGGNLTLAHCLILVRLLRDCSCRQSDVHAETGITAGYLTRLLDKLEAQGLVRRQRSISDRRQILLSLTDRGTDAALSLLAAMDAEHLLSPLDKLQSSLDRFLSFSAPEVPR